MLLSIDPGIDTGWAVWAATGSLVTCGLGPPSNNTLHGIREAVIEKPQVYVRGKGDPNDLITLAILVGQYKERLEKAHVPVTLVIPHTWKGNVPKSIHNDRVLGKLTVLERALYTQSVLSLAVSKRHNVIDAIGLGLWLLKR